MDKSPLSLSLSLSRKINLGNFESADVFLSLSGITVDTTEAEMDELLDGNGALAFKKLSARIKEKVDQARPRTG